jgi:hypothetical protein
MKASESPPSEVRTSTASSSSPKLNESRQISFEAVKNRDPTIWEAAVEESFTIKKGGRDDLFTIEAEDGVVDDALPVQNASLIESSAGQFWGWCSCRDFEREHVCPHLCAIRMHAALNMLTIPRE